jgi:hypothetical protein
MLKLYKPINFPFIDVIASETLKLMNNVNDGRLSIREIPFSDKVMDDINSYLNLRGVSNLRSKLSFKRLGGVQSHTDCHVDGTSNITYNCSLVIPVYGCKNTYQYWYNGDYTLKFWGEPERGVVLWNSLPNYLDKIEIYDSSMLCRVNIPHSAVGKDNEYRITCTLRFQENETFEYLYEHLK